jgi:3-hydroxyisobutyrate dehydrogenase-like beta-hydroxyacid dehydrogenase
MEKQAIGLVGFGEAGFHFAKGLTPGARLFAYDINAETPEIGERIRARAAELGVTLVASPAALARECPTILSVVTADSAVEAARQNVGWLEARHIYADLNSVAPQTKREISGIVGTSPAQFVEAAIMAPVKPLGHQTPILLNGVGAETLINRLDPLGMRLEAMSGEIGSAAAVKMFRSIIVKGMEALIFECVLGASAYGAAERVFASLDESFPGLDFHALADYMIGRVVVHGERRAREMEEVAATLRSVGVNPIMAQATAQRQDWSAKLNLRSHFGPEGPPNYDEVLRVLEKLKTA